MRRVNVDRMRRYARRADPGVARGVLIIPDDLYTEEHLDALTAGWGRSVRPHMVRQSEHARRLAAVQHVPTYYP